MSEGIALVLDVLILSLLAATVFFAARLSVHLKIFRDSRIELQVLISELGQNTKKAEEAMADLRGSVREIEHTLESRMHEACSLSEELQFMNESADQIAGRLERAATRTSDDRTGHEAIADMSIPHSFEEDSSDFMDEAELDSSKKGSGFAIRDSEREQDLYDNEGNTFSDFLQDNMLPREGLQSRAEQELYEALQSRKKQKTSAGGTG